jgi:hypothetical protein
MDNQTIIERGNASAELLNNESFTQLFKELMDHYINQFITSDPAQKEVRDAAYFQSRSLQDILGVMQQWIVMRDQILEAKEND